MVFLLKYCVGKHLMFLQINKILNFWTGFFFLKSLKKVDLYLIEMRNILILWKKQNVAPSSKKILKISYKIIEVRTIFNRVDTFP